MPQAGKKVKERLRATRSALHRELELLHVGRAADCKKDTAGAK